MAFGPPKRRYKPPKKPVTPIFKGDTKAQPRRGGGGGGTSPANAATGFKKPPTTLAGTPASLSNVSLQEKVKQGQQYFADVKKTAEATTPVASLGTAPLEPELGATGAEEGAQQPLSAAEKIIGGVSQVFENIQSATTPRGLEGIDVIAGTVPIGPTGGTLVKPLLRGGIGAIDKGFRVGGGTLKSVKSLVNTWKITQTTSWITKLSAFTGRHSIATAASIAAIIVGAVGSFPFADVQKDKAVASLNQTISDAVASGDVNKMKDAQRIQEEILNPDLWREMISNIPFGNAARGLLDIYDAATTENAIYIKTASDAEIQQSTGETEDAKWERIRIEEKEQDIYIIDYYNEQKIITEKEIAEIIRKERIETSAAAKAVLKENIRLWEEYAARQRKMEEEDRAAIAAFWLAYRRKSQKIFEESRPSKLNFGIL